MLLRVLILALRQKVLIQRHKVKQPVFKKQEVFYFFSEPPTILFFCGFL